MATTTRAHPQFSPLSYKESFKQWISSYSQSDAQEQVLSLLPFYPESDGKRLARVNKTDIGNNLFINEFEIDNVEGNYAPQSTSSSKDLVILHGYGAGLGFFYKNLDGLTRLPGRKVFALDLLGYGMSARPKFRIQSKEFADKDDLGRSRMVIETEDWFIDALEAWRKAKNIDKFTLMGHSFGGYLATAYSFKYPNRVNKLVLVSPAGIDRGYTPELDDSRLFRTKKAEKNTKKPLAVNDANDAENSSWQTLAEAAEADDIDAQAKSLNAAAENSADRRPRQGRQLPHLLVYLWNNHYSPLSLIRKTHFLAPRLISQWSYRRFGDLPDNEREIMHLYAYKTFVAKPSGDYALTRVLAPGALARMPMVDRVRDQLKCPSLWLYGDHDWMSQEAGSEAATIMNSFGDKQRKAKFNIIENAGHHLYLDNPERFNQLVLDFIK